MSHQPGAAMPRTASRRQLSWGRKYNKVTKFSLFSNSQKNNNENLDAQIQQGNN